MLLTLSGNYIRSDNLKKVLVVDDTKNIRMLLTTCLELNGYDVITANNGTQAIEIFKSTNLDLAFLDIKLPEMSGTEVLRRIRDHNILVPVVIMTAFATVKNAIDCTKLGAVAYLQKPFTADKVKSVLLQLSKYANQNEHDDISSQILKAETLINSGNINEAYDQLRHLLSIDPSYPRTYELIGLIYEKNNDLATAKKFYNTAKQFK